MATSKGANTYNRQNWEDAVSKLKNGTSIQSKYMSIFIQSRIVERTGVFASNGR